MKRPGISRAGQQRNVDAPGEVLVQQGDSEVRFFVVVSGELEVLRPSGTAETLFTVHSPGQLGAFGPSLFVGSRVCF
jgi:CRP-like cAMP-binding protein